MQRRVNVRPPRDTFLIVCEGKKTEPNYFKAFRVPATVEEFNVVGLGDNTLSLVERAIELKQKLEYDQVWCVFDRDSFSASQFNDALALADREEMKVAYSNEAFELWYLLHFNYHDTAMSRADYPGKLSKLLEFRYRKNFPGMYELLLPRQQTAIKNAKKLLAQYKPSCPAADNPSTSVHLLVEQLNRFIASC
jgi:hypothetical protein